MGLSIFSSCLSEMVYETGCEILYKMVGYFIIPADTKKSPRTVDI